MNWTKVTKKLPPCNEHGFGGDVFVFGKYIGIQLATFQQNKFVTWEMDPSDPDESITIDLTGKISHWMDIDLPKD
jgi:hypothetical protein